jgi:adenylate cyclase class IV
MAIEVELKAYTGVPITAMAKTVIKRLLETKKYPLIGYTIFTYRDVYLTLEDQNMVRVRATHDHTPPDFENDVHAVYVTYEKKQVVDGIERNSEDETSVDQTFEDVIDGFFSQGYKILYQKTKTGLKYAFHNGITLQAQSVWSPSDAASIKIIKVSESVQILSFGQFFEIEKVLPDSATEADITLANETLLRLFEDLGLPAESIEPRSWKALDAEVREQVAQSQTNTKG